jgi:hypothetical protein
VTGTGTTPDDPVRPVVADLAGLNWSGDMDRANNRAFVVVATANHAVVRSAPGVDALPDFPLDGKLSAINQGTLNAMSQVLTRRGFGASLSNSESYRAELDRIGRQINANFSIDNLDVSE